MNRSRKTAFPLALAAARLAGFVGVVGLAGVLAGCGSLDAEGEGAAFPEPIGYDQAMQAHPGAGASQTAQVGTDDAAASGSAQLPPGEVPGSTSEARANAAPPQGDIVVGADENDYADTDPAALTDFRTTLDPYGTWVDDGTYGTVWTPSPSVVGNDFAPYVSAGHWTYDDEWVWASDYDWGWAPFHYGRWVYIGGRGWGWIPGRTYSGAWVSWRYGYDGYGYLGWAPMPPTWYWYGGYALGIAVVPRAPYVFCGYHDVFAPNVAGRIVTGSQVGVVAGHTRPYTPAAPSVGGSVHTPAHPTVGGPPPSSLGFEKSQIAHIAPTDRGLLRAQQFAHPQTAQALGARAPTTFNAGPRVATAPSIGTRSSFAPSRNFNAPVATAPRYQGIAPTPYRPPPSYGAYGSYGGSPAARSFGGGYAAPGGQRFAPSYGGGYSTPHYGGGYAPAPHYGSMGSSPSFAPHPYGGGFHPGAVPGATGSHAPTPDYSGPPPAARSSGGFHGGGFRGATGGGFHGGGGRR
jgi:hypothetical protein